MSTDDFRSEARALLNRLLDEAATNEHLHRVNGPSRGSIKLYPGVGAVLPIPRPIGKLGLVGSRVAGPKSAGGCCRDKNCAGKRGRGEASTSPNGWRAWLESILLFIKNGRPT